jgi:2-deoxy-D-gluconate 3-dehydrogenase
MSDYLDSLFSLSGKTALVAGGAGAIGRVLARALAASGARVAVHDYDQGRLDDVKRLFEGDKLDLLTFKADLTDAGACRALVDQTSQSLGGLDILVNSQGVNRRKRIDAVTPEDFDAILAVNLRSVYFLGQAAHPHFKARGGGKIVNISSLSAKHAFNTISVYAASKAGVSQLTKAQAREWVGDNIQVNAIEPGFVKTEFTRPLWDDAYRAEWFRRFIPAGRLANPDDLIGAVLLLASKASAYITGQAIAVDGGVLSGATWEEPER